MIGEPYVVCGWLVLSLAGSWTTAVKVSSNKVILFADRFPIVKNVWQVLQDPFRSLYIYSAPSSAHRRRGAKVPNFYRPHALLSLACTSSFGKRYPLTFLTNEL